MLDFHQRIDIFTEHLRSIILALLWRVDSRAQDESHTCWEVKLLEKKMLGTGPGRGGQGKRSHLYFRW